MSKSLLYAVNSTAQTVAENATINFGNIVRRYGNNVNMSGSNPVISGVGYYGIDTNIVVNPTTTGELTITLYKDGSPIAGATQTFTVTAVGDYFSVSIPAVVRQNCCIQSTITAVLTGVSGSVTNATILIEKS